MGEKEERKDIPGLKVEPSPKGKDDPKLEPVSFPLGKAASLDAGFLSTWKKEKPLSALMDEVRTSPETKFSQMSRVETKYFDATFVDALEDGMAAIAKIISNPRTFIKEEAELVNSEKAKKVSPISIQHFASHSQYLRNITKTGEVIPDKLLTIHSETDTAIYENRFVMTLIKRCMSFINTRVAFIKEHGETLDSDELLVHTKVNLGGIDYEVDMKVRASVPSDDAGESKKNADLLARLNECRDQCGYFLRSPFMAQMKGAKDVSVPVHMTNMLLKNPDYHKAYVLWCFIDAYESLGVSYDVKEKRGRFSEEYLDSLYRLVGSSIATLHSHHTASSKVIARSSKKITPQIIFSLDEVSYMDGRFIYDAYPAAKEAIDPTQCLTEEGQKVLIAHKVDKLRLEGKAKPVVKAAVQKHKDQEVSKQAQDRLARARAAKEAKRLAAEKAEKAKRIEAAKKEDEKKKRLLAKKKAEEEKYLLTKRKLEGK